MERRGQGSVYKRCGCRDAATGRRKGPGCDLLRRPGHGSWYLSLEIPAGAAGERRRLRLGGHRSRRQAEMALRVLQAPCSAGGTSAWTTGRWLQQWLAGRVSLRPSTRRMYESHLRLYLLPHLDRTPLSALSIGEVRAMFLAISRRHQALGTPLSATTVHSIRCTLRAALNAAIREGLLTDNPARWVELPTHHRPHAVVWTRARVAAWQAGGARPKVAVWTAADTARFLTAIEQDELHPLLYLVALRGLRRGEAAGLCWPDVDLDEGTLTISRTLPRAPRATGAATAEECRQRPHPRPGPHHRRSPRSPPCQPAPGRWRRPTRGLRLRPHRRPALQPGLPDPSLPGTGKALWAAAHPLHDLRHGAATLALAAGADLKAIQDMLGHASIVLTADTYTSVLPEVARQTAEGIAALVLAAGRNPPGRSTGPPRRPAGLTTGSPRPHQPTGHDSDGGKSPGQKGCAARDLNPQPAD